MKPISLANAKAFFVASASFVKPCTPQERISTPAALSLSFAAAIFALSSVMGSCLPKEVWLRVFRETTFPLADDYIMVGNIAGVSGASDDKGAAEAAGWRFISEKEFAEGSR